MKYNVLLFLRNATSWGIIAIVFLILLIMFFYKYNKEAYRNIVAAAIIDAEIYFKSGEGSQKLIYAADKIHGLLPWYLRMCISNQVIKTTIEEVLKGLQKIFKHKQLAE